MPNDIYDSDSVSICLCLDYQPDNIITGIGDDIYNTSGSGQSASQTVDNGTTATYIVTIQNDGQASDNFTVFGTAGSGCWTVNYFDAPTGGNDITDNITSSSTWVTPELAPGESTQIRLEVTPLGCAPNSTFDVTITSTSNSCGCIQDTVLAITRTTVPPPQGGGGGGTYDPCSQILTVNNQGETTIVTMTTGGVLCEDCVASDPQNQLTLEMDRGTRLTLANNQPPKLIKITLAGSPPAPTDATIVGHIYDFNAYVSMTDTNPLPLTITPTGRIDVAYSPENLPDNTSELGLAFFDENEDLWVALDTTYAGVAAPGTAVADVGHFTYFALLAKTAGQSSAKFDINNLIISPMQPQLNEEVTISVNVINNGGTTGDYNLELKIDGVTAATRQGTLGPQSSKTVSFTVTADAIGKHKIEISNLGGEFEVVGLPAGSGINWWLIAGIIVLIIGIMLVLWFTWGKKRFGGQKPPAVQASS